MEMDQTAWIRNDYMCVFCHIPMGKAHCYSCGDYKGAMTRAEYAKFVDIS